MTVTEGTLGVVDSPVGRIDLDQALTDFEALDDIEEILETARLWPEVPIPTIIERIRMAVRTTGRL